MFLILLLESENGYAARITEFAEKDYNNLKKYCKARLCSKGLFSFDSAEKEAEKIVQDCFLLLCEKCRSTEISNIKAWMYRTADILVKKETRLRAVDLKFLHDSETSLERAGDMTYDNETDDIGYAFLETLNDEDREMMELYYGSGKTLEELAHDMGIKPETLRKRKSRFEKKMKKLFKEFADKN